MIIYEWVSLLLKLSLYQLYHLYIFICFIILPSLKVFRTHPVEHKLIAHFQKKCRAGPSMGEGSIMGSFGGALAFVFNLVRLKVAEHSFQVLMLWRQFFARVKVNHRSVYSRIMARVCAVAMAMELVKNKAYKMVFIYF